MTRQKRNFLLIAAIAFLALLLLCSIPLIIGLFRQDEPPRKVIHFADPALSADIYADAAYMALDRGIYYRTNDGYVIRTEIPPEEYIHYSEAVQMLIRFVAAAREGDHAAYNACFSPAYLAESGETVEFTMQKIYDVTITQYRAVGVAVPEGYEKVYLFGLSYKIKDNNGSLRSDMGSDCEHEQFLTVVEDAERRTFIHGVRLYFHA